MSNQNIPPLVDDLRFGADAGPVLELIAKGRFASPAAHRLRLQAERMSLMTGFDVLASLDTLSFEPFDYQIRAAQTALRRFRGRGLLCDEVGLGKTIEAGLVLKEYMLRQMVRRVLIITPPGLAEQWREELASKFGLDDFVTNYDQEFRELGTGAWEHFPRVIASLATARRVEHRSAIGKQVYDLVVVDEAHHLKNRSSASWKLVNALQKKYILMLTATPVENNLGELYNLITILKPGQLATPREFRRQFVIRGDPRLPKNRGQLRELLADVMVRHSRSQINLQLPPRSAHTVRLGLSPQERALYDDISAFVRQRMTEGSTSQANKFTLRLLQREIGSCAAAARPTLLAMASHKSMAAYQDELQSLAERAEELSTWSKAEALDRLLQSGLLADPNEKVIIFTHFRVTLALLADRLRENDIDLVTYQGQMTIAQKDEAIRHFEREGRVLLSTEAAGEGRNLQFCRTMINFDLPWNPQRIEQRVGRIHRIGQTRPVEIFNLSAQSTVEDYILEILDRKLNMFELVIGEMEMILGHMVDHREFDDIIMDLWTEAPTPESVADRFAELGDDLVKARETYNKARAHDEALFGKDFSTE